VARERASQRRNRRTPRWKELNLTIAKRRPRWCCVGRDGYGGAVAHLSKSRWSSAGARTFTWAVYRRCASLDKGSHMKKTKAEFGAASELGALGILRTHAAAHDCFNRTSRDGRA
jgi:hypothetical protein